MYDFGIKQGDTGPALLVELLDGDEAADVSLASSVRFTMVHRTKDHAITGNAVIVDGTSIARYAWQPGDTDEIGDYYGEIEVTFSDDSVETWPRSGFINIRVNADLD